MISADVQPGDVRHAGGVAGSSDARIEADLEKVIALFENLLQGMKGTAGQRQDGNAAAATPAAGSSPAASSPADSGSAAAGPAASGSAVAVPPSAQPQAVAAGATDQPGGAGSTAQSPVAAAAAPIAGASTASGALPADPGTGDPIGTTSGDDGLAQRKQVLVSAMDAANIPKNIQAVVVAEGMQEGDLSPSALDPSTMNTSSPSVDPFNVPLSRLQAGGFQGNAADAANPADLGAVGMAIAHLAMGADTSQAGDDPANGNYGASIVKDLEIVRGGGAAETDPNAYGASNFASGILDVARQIQTDPSLLTDGTRVAPNMPGV